MRDFGPDSRGEFGSQNVISTECAFQNSMLIRRVNGMERNPAPGLVRAALEVIGVADREPRNRGAPDGQPKAAVAT